MTETSELTKEVSTRLAVPMSGLGEQMDLCARAVAARLLREHIAPDVIVLCGKRSIPAFYAERVNDIIRRIS